MTETERETVIRTDRLTKHYSGGRGCHEISLTVGSGEAFGFLGPNGAGKSTFVKSLVGLIFPTSGTGTLFGAPIGSLEARRQIGYLPELYRYQEWLTGEEVLWLHAKLCKLDKSYARKRIDSLLMDVGIGKRGRDRVKQYSKGMQQRLGLACALLNDPKLLFLDEPTSAMDPIGRYEVRGMLQQLRGAGKTIFLNSHLLEDVEMICDRVALLNNGRILTQGSVRDVLLEKSRWTLRVGGMLPEDLEELIETTALPITCPDPNPDAAGAVWIEVEAAEEEQLGWLNTLIMERGLTLYEVQRMKNRLDEWFMQTLSGLDQRGERE
ncbi:ABC transporter ATP-binding protein [Paenibacillus vietnamensis]|uniref:ABC transporter ATP-binding protein n=1 Tax=Paenibacillus vietnamensis TaxID=2590547 RepID=UPI001CD08E86|nr:ABC transporter ATP-binding protein [Paenibacillus vietnamensis]